ncbi:YcaO-like family protein [Polaromonas sp.]|uniref:YcaO-like family protein n=1 Tax=Polaromonas sp. TaxID=1869339 RepID=UPI0032671D13
MFLSPCLARVGNHEDEQQILIGFTLQAFASEFSQTVPPDAGARVAPSMIPPLQVPVVYGHWLVEGNKLICRLPRKSVTIRAPKKLLFEIMQCCDGTLAWSEVLARLHPHWETTALTAFMLELTRNGVLVEASQLWARWGDVAQLPAATAIATNSEDMGMLHQVAEKRLLPGCGFWQEDVRLGQNRLAHMLALRESSRTFDDKPVSVECLCSILWAAHGVTRPGEPGTVAWHRTIASGGNMHSARWFVAVLRDLPAEGAQCKPFSIGVYEARFHVLGGASLHKVDGEADDAWRCLRDPRVLRFASALILPIYDVAVPGKKYGNRATLFAMIEAGQALQNAQLMSAELGAAGMLRGDTTAQECLDMLGLQNGSSSWFVVPALVLGAKPSQMQLKQQQAENFLKIAPNLRTTGPSFAFAAGSTALGDASPFTASGRSSNPKLALTKAEAEGWERLAWATLHAVELARFTDLQRAVDPRELVAYSARQYARPDFPCAPFSERRQYLWAKAIDAGTGQTCSVLADCTYANVALPLRFQKTSFTSASTSGMAAGTSQEDALCRATLELIERDAFARAWFSRCAPRAVRTSSLPKAAAQRIAELVRSGFRIVVSDLSTAWAPVMSIFAQSNALPLTAITAAAHFSAEQALEKALDEIEGRIAHAQHFDLPGDGDTDPMREIERYYRSRRTYKNSDFYAKVSDAVAFRTVGRSACRDWSQLQSDILRDGFRLLAVDMTPGNAAVEQGRVPLHVVRAIVPGLVPIWFQACLQPEGMPRFFESAGGAKGKYTSRLFIHPFT